MRTRRLARCAACGLGEAACLCATIRPIAVRTRVVVIAHCIELHRSSNTGKLAVRLLERASLRVRGERDAPAAPEAELAARRLVLFPATGARELRASDAGDDLVLVVPDGSWPQARKAAAREPLARGAEAVVLPPGAPSRYPLRRAPRAEGLCTLEAIARALGVLEGEEVERAMLETLDLFVARHRALRASGS